MGGNPWCKGGTGKAEAAKLQDAGISPKQWPKKMRGRKRLAYQTRQKSVRRAGHVNIRNEKNGRECTSADAASWKNCTEGRKGQYRIVGTGQSGERIAPWGTVSAVRGTWP
jgi:hypothetical protein